MTKDNDIVGETPSVSGLVNKLQYDTVKQNKQMFIKK